MNKYSHYILFFFLVFVLTKLVTSCARMGQPDGGWYDEKPPYVVSASPADNGTDVKSKKIKITFNEFIKVDNPTENVMVSPPQLEQPEVKATGKNIVVELQDSLKPNTTYTIDFSNAITDNNEGNPMGNYTYTFSTGKEIDTLEVSGYVLEAENLEPIKGILVGLYAPGDSVMRRVSRTDAHGKFVVRGIAPGRYTVGALQDQDNDFKFSQRSEKVAFSKDTITPYCHPDTRQDTIWLDSLHIKDIKKVGYTHFFPDNITLRAFTHKTTDRFFLKADRTEANHFTIVFTAPTPDRALPKLRLLNDSIIKNKVHGGTEGEYNPFLAEPSAMADSIVYWLRDTALVNQDTLMVEMKTLITDTLGVLQPETDTLEILAKTPYAKRLKEKQKKADEWKKDIEKKLKKATSTEVIDTIMPKEELDIKYDCPSQMEPNGVITIESPTPLERFDTAGVHLYVEQDSLWFRAPLTIEYEQRDSTMSPDTTGVSRLSRKITLFTDWIPGANYSFEVDSLAFKDIYGLTMGKYKAGIQVSKLEDYGTLFVNISGADSAIVQLMNKNDAVVMSSPTKNGTAEFYYIKPDTYYLRAFVDRNGNGVWDIGDYYTGQQPEEVYYNPESIECKAKWDLTRNWNVTSVPLNKQKPLDITKQKPEAEKTIKKRNFERAKEKGIVLPEYLQ